MTSTQGKAQPPVNQFVTGGLAGIVAAFSTHPFDLIKVRMQLYGEGGATGKRPGIAATGWKVIQDSGIKGLFKGFSASALRQMTYTTTRVGLYDVIKQTLEPILAPDAKKTNTTPLYFKLLSSSLAGAGGVIVGNPADVVLVRMQADGRLPKHLQRGYRHALHGLYCIAHEEGIPALWKGVGPNIARGMLMTVGQLASYDQAKQTLLQTGMFKDNFITHLGASCFAGLVAATITSPLDVVKTRIMNAKKAEGSGGVVYRGTFDAFWKIFRAEGPMAFYKGWLPYFARLFPNTVIMLVVNEQLIRIARWLQQRQS